MALVVCDGGLVAFTQQWKTWLNTLTLRLFQNNHVPAQGDTAASYTQANFTGYAAIPLTAWGNAFLNAASDGEIDETNRMFTQTGAAVTCNVFGYYITDGFGNLIYAERSALAPFNMNAAGLVYAVLPRITTENL